MVELYFSSYKSAQLDQRPGAYTDICLRYLDTEPGSFRTLETWSFLSETESFRE